MSRSAKILAILVGLCILSLAVQGCRFFQAEATFQIRVTDGSGEPLADSQILIQKKFRGHTDAQGLASISVDLPVDESILVEINKPSTQLFYAPYFETIRVGKGELNRFIVHATLYGVPKNSPDMPASSNEGGIAKPESSAGPSPAKVAEPTAGAEDPGLAVALETVNNDNTMVSLPTNGAADDDKAQANLEPFDPELSAQKAANTLLENADQSSRLITFYVANGRENVADARILYGDMERGQWLEGCSTNARGRCTLTLPASFSTENVHLLIRANNFQPQTKIISLSQGDKVRVDLIRGQALEVFAVQKNYRSIRGLAGVNISYQNKALGRTDTFGYFASNLLQTPTEPSAVLLEAPGHLPSQAKQDIGGSAPLTIMQSFSDKSAPKARLLLLPLKIQNSGTETPNPALIMAWDKLMQDGIRQNLVNQAPFIEADWERISLVMERYGLSLQQLGRQGWNQPDLISEFEWALRPTLILGPASSLEVSLINADGQIIGSSLQRLTTRPDAKALRGILASASRDLSVHSPFEGSLVEAEKDGFRINLSQQGGHSLKIGETLRLHGLTADSPGSRTGWTDIGSAQVTELGEGFTRIRVQDLKPRTTATVGQIVALNRRPEASDRYMTVTDQSDKHPLSQANLYLQDRWIGTTDKQGIARLSPSASGRRGLLTVVRLGYQIRQDDFNWIDGQDKTITMNRSSIPIRIETDPSNAQIKMNGRLIGRSPLYQSIDIPGPTAQIEIYLSEEFKKINQTVSFDEEGLDWSGVRAVHLEKDMRREARQLIQAGRLTEAINLLEALPESNPDFLIVQHELGDIYLNQSQDPIKAAAAFHRVTVRPEIANFIDKRFIGTHINEAIAMFHIGEKIKDSDQAAALSSWQRSKEKLDQCEGQLRFIPEEQYTQAVHSLSYYRALSLHRIWGQTQKTEDLKSAHNAWKRYIETMALSTPSDKHYSLVKKAEVFYRQTQKLMEPAEQAQAQRPDPKAKAL